MSVTNLLCHQINFQSKNLFYFYCQKQFSEQFYGVLIFCGCVGHHHMGLTVADSLIATFRKTLIANVVPLSEKKEKKRN